MKKYFFGMLFLILTYSCVEDKDNIVGQIEIPGETQTLLKFGAEGGDEDILFSSTLGWKATSSAEWVQISPAYGKAGESTLKLSVTPSDEVRSATITIDNGESTKEIQIEQSKYSEASNFIVYATELTLEKYEDEKFEWHLLLKDETYAFSYGRDGRCAYMKLYVDKTHDFSKGIPAGNYPVGDGKVGTSIGMMANGRDQEPVESGFVEIIKNGNDIKVGLMIEVKDKEKVITYYDVQPDLFHFFNYAYGSTIGRDLKIDNYDQAYVKNEGDIFGQGKRYWDLNIAQRDIQFKYVGVHEGVGEWLALTLITPMEATSPVGTYEFVMDDRNLIDYTALGGYRSTMSNMGFNSWWRSQIGPNDFIEESPFVAGTVDVKENADGTYSVEVLAVDDALPENNSLIVKYNGPLAIYDPTNTGDFAMASADFYGPFQFDSPNMNWFVGVGDKSFADSRGGKGSIWVFDLMANPEQKFTKGVPYGSYRIGENTNYEAGTIHMAYHRIYDEYEMKEEIKLVSGQLELSKMPDGRERLQVDAVDVNGKRYKGTYMGLLPTNSVSYPPYTDRVFNGVGAKMLANFYGRNYAPENETPQKVGWDLAFEDSEFYNSRGQTGLNIVLELRTKLSTNFADGLPAGIYPVYEPNQNGVEEGLYNGDFTYYTVAYETAQSKVKITGGFITVSKENGKTIIDFDLETANEYVRYTVTGRYDGEIMYNDFSASPNSVKNMRQTKSFKAAPAEQKGYHFKK